MINTFIRDVTGAERELFELEQSLGHVDQCLVVDFITERDVERSDATGALGQVRHARVRDVVARAQVQFAQRCHFGQVLETAVADRHAKAQVDRFQLR